MAKKGAKIGNIGDDFNGWHERNLEKHRYMTEI